MNETILTAVGNLATAVDHRFTAGGAAVASFRIACNERRYDRSREHFVDGDTFYIRVTCWRSLADRVAHVFEKGDAVIVRGRIVSRSYQHEGTTRYVTEMEANAVGADIGRGAVTVAHRRKGEPGDVGEGSSPVTGADDPWTTPVDGQDGSSASGVWGSADEPIDELTGHDGDVPPAELEDALPGSGR